MSRAVRTPPAALKLTLALLATAALAGCTTTSPDAAIAPVREQLRAATGADIARWPDAQAPSAEARARLDALRDRPQALLAQRLQREALHLRGLARSLHAISPLATVARGYSILQQADGHIVRSIADAASGDALDARLHDGRLRLRVETKEPNP